MKPSAIITGAAGGVGRATVELFASRDWEVFALDRRDVKGFPKGTTFHKMDVSDPKSVNTFFSVLENETNQIQVLVNNAAIQICKPLVDMSVEEWDAIMNSNLRSIFLMTRGAYKYLKAANGAVVNVSSVHAVATSTDIAAYAASKGGAMALTRAMAIEFAPDGVRVNAILPGAVDTGMLRSGLDRDHVEGTSIEDRLDHLAQRTVIGRVGEPEEIAHSIFFLADNNQSSFMTGQALIVDGGATARLSTE
jgi:glucose 1-dehydrogenase